MSVNYVILVGNLANDPEAYTTQGGVSRSTFRVAVQRKFANAQGVREADFLTVVAWRNAADFCNKYLKKGNKVAVEGSIQTRSYDAQDGSKRWVTEIIAEHIDSLDRPQEGGQKPSGNARGKQQEEKPGDFVPVDDDDELPF